MLKSRASRERRLLDAGYRFAFALTHEASEAEDLVQAACVRLLDRYGRVESEALLVTVVRNLFYDRARRDKVVVFEPLEARFEAVPGADAALVSVDVRLDLDVLLAKLRPEEREALYLNVVAGYTLEEIAELTGRPAGTIGSLIHRARRKLTEAAAEQGARRSE
jgi:RNA polymerase sigma-70 factor (ECF subfamily)